jgi:hypothetical protein
MDFSSRRSLQKTPDRKPKIRARLFEIVNLGSRKLVGLLRQFHRLSKSHPQRVIVLILTGIIGVLYSPVFTAYFAADDFNFLRFLHFNVQPLLNGQLWNEWFIGGVENYAVFRPMGRLYWLLNYVAFGLEPYGYHIATVVFHLIASFAAGMLTFQLTRNRLTAGIGAVLFAIMPVHAEAVAWVAANYDVLSGMYFLGALIFYILYRQRNSLRFYLVALGAFVLGLASKETALTLPMILFLYDVLSHPRDWTRARQVLLGYIPFGLVLAVRFIYFGQGYRGLIFAPEGLAYYLDLSLLRVFNPLPEAVDTVRWIALGCAAALLLAFRFRGIVLFALLWIPVTLIPTLVGGVTDRSFYIPSFGIALLLAIVLTSLLTHRATLARTAGLVGLIVLIAVYSAALFDRNQAFVRASQVAQTILQRVAELHPTVLPDARLVFVGAPDYVPEGPAVFGVGLPDAMSLLYGYPSMRVFKFSKFPVWLDDLNHTYFFQVDHRRVTERADLIAALEARKRCSSFSQPALTWTFTSDPQGWEPWNQLDGFENRDGALVTRSTGNDPFMGGPHIDIPALEIGDIEITMRVRASQPTFEGKVYWLASGQQDFSPALKQSFTGQADGKFHTYRVDISSTAQLLMGDRIERLRLDPVDVPAEIEIKEIRVDHHCASLQDGNCECAR